ncbi:ankyrin repeat domain-containing protein SOWAHB-like, partial [Diadema antillarum]|uniref:ankyrin repeat domain-containing protein SOWAHB-like n=1 Tax=Diadema antillarum TaxID=105358 RepID=UPI003A86A12A
SLQSALHWGAKHGKKEMIRLVADRGIDINMRSQGGYTPLHIAAMHNKEAIMQFLVTEYHADIDKRDYSGRKPRHYLQSAASNYIKQMMHGQSTAEVIKPHNLMSLAEPKQEETKRHSRLGSILRSSFRNSFRLWGSAENLEDKDHKRDRTPPVTPPPSPKTRPKSAHNLSYTHLLPPPSGYTVPNRSRKLRSTSDKNREDQIRRFDSDPDMLTESTTATFV